MSWASIASSTPNVKAAPKCTSNLCSKPACPRSKFTLCLDHVYDRENNTKLITPPSVKKSIRKNQQRPRKLDYYERWDHGLECQCCGSPGHAYDCRGEDCEYTKEYMKHPTILFWTIRDYDRDDESKTMQSGILTAEQWQEIQALRKQRRQSDHPHDNRQEQLLRIRFITDPRTKLVNFNEITYQHDIPASVPTVSAEMIRQVLSHQEQIELADVLLCLHGREALLDI